MTHETLDAAPLPDEELDTNDDYFLALLKGIESEATRFGELLDALEQLDYFTAGELPDFVFYRREQFDPEQLAHVYSLARHLDSLKFGPRG